MISHSRAAGGLILLLIVTISAATGAVITRAVDQARGVRVSMGYDGSEVLLWNSTAQTWRICSVVLDNRYGLETASIPVRTLLMLPKRLFGAPDDWEPRRAVVRCEEPRSGSWESRVSPY